MHADVVAWGVGDKVAEQAACFKIRINHRCYGRDEQDGLDVVSRCSNPVHPVNPVCNFRSVRVQSACGWSFAFLGRLGGCFVLWVYGSGVGLF